MRRHRHSWSQWTKWTEGTEHKIISRNMLLSDEMCHYLLIFYTVVPPWPWKILFFRSLCCKQNCWWCGQEKQWQSQTVATPQDLSGKLTGRHMRPEASVSQIQGRRANLSSTKRRNQVTRFLVPSAHSDYPPESTSIKANHCGKPSAQHHISASVPSNFLHLHGENR